jgi:hypothetical protein
MVDATRREHGGDEVAILVKRVDMLSYDGRIKRQGSDKHIPDSLQFAAYVLHRRHPLGNDSGCPFVR